MRSRILEHLRALVACDTRNPPRGDDGITSLFAYATGVLAPAGFDISERDLSDGCRYLWAVRGDARGAPIVNVHIDTVPLAEGWSRDPFTLHVDSERATGLGACDIKGAVAAYLTAAERTSGPSSLLLSSDEEAGSSLCVRTFISEHDVAGRVFLVAEPTCGRAVIAHRGIGTALVTFDGEPGHASLQRSLSTSAVSRAVRFCAEAMTTVGHSDNVNRLNLGRIEGGTKANMIAASCMVRLGVRPPPETPADVLLDELRAIAATHHGVLERGFLAPALPASFASRGVFDARARSAAAAAALELPLGDDVDFFTEAAFFSAAGADAIVFGPGDIAQAHTADEWVRLDDLDVVGAHYTRLLSAR